MRKILHRGKTQYIMKNISKSQYKIASNMKLGNSLIILQNSRLMKYLQQWTLYLVNCRHFMEKRTTKTKILEVEVEFV